MDRDEELEALRSETARLREALVRAGEMVTLLAHGVTWEIAPSIQERARETEVLVLTALGASRPEEGPQTSVGAEEPPA